MLLFFRLPFVLLELVVRQGARSLGAVVRMLRGDDGGEREQWRPAPTQRVASDLAGATATMAADVEDTLEEQGVSLREESPAENAFGIEEEEPGAAVEEPAGPPPPSADEAIRRRQEREAIEQVAPPANEPEAPAPLRVVGEDERVDSEATLVESFGPSEDVAGNMTVDEPWEGYDGMAATAVVARLRGADEATRAVVRLYEQTHKRRQTILRATG